MACSRCNQRRAQLVAAAKATVAGDRAEAVASVTAATQSLREDMAAVATKAAQRLAAAHARLRR